MFRKIFLLVFVFFLLPFSSKAITDNEVYLFWAEGCPHCVKEQSFLEQMKDKYPDLVIYSYDVTKSSEGIELIGTFEQKFGIEVTGVPFIVIGDDYYVGYYDDATSGTLLEGSILKIYTPESEIDILDNSVSVVDDVEDSKLPALIDAEPAQEEKQIDDSVKEGSSLPEVAGFNLSAMSLPVVTVVLGFLDGFNPCAMWALIFLITLLLGMENKKRMWTLGVVFIVASALVYFLFMVAWLNLILFLEFIFLTRLIIGLVAIGGGVWNIKKFFTNRDGTCEVTGSNEKKKIFEKLRNITRQKSFVLELVGIILLAFAVNLVELICSAGLPAIYTQILALNNLSTWQYYGYIMLYILFFMLDDLFVFIAAMLTLQLTGISTKYSRWSSLIGGLLILLIGLLLIFKHETLMFN